VVPPVRSAHPTAEETGIAITVQEFTTLVERLAQIDLFGRPRSPRTCWHGPGFEGAVVRLSRLGQHSRLWMSVALAEAARDRKQRGRYLRLPGVLAASEVANGLDKLAIDRRRPALPGLSPLMSTPSDRSCPSAHASTSFTAARRYRSDVLAGVALFSAGEEMGGP
jgi:hypothetical protein